MLKNKKGVTYIELMLAVATVIILSVISLKIYGYNSEKAVAVEGVQLMREIANVEIVYRMENKEWCFDFDKLPLKIEGKKVEEQGDNVIKTKDFVFFLSENGNNKDLSIKAIRSYDGDIDIGERNSRGYSMTMLVKFDLSNKNVYSFNAKGYNVYARIERALANYLNKRFEKNK